MITNQLQVNSVLMFETGTYNDQFLRPFETAMDYNTVNQFAAQTENGMNLSTTALAPIANGIMRPTAMASAIAGIDNGWGTKRLSFYIDAVVSNIGGANREIISGYTDYVGASPSGAIDPNMRLYFNSTMMVHERQMAGASGVQTQLVTRDSSHILRPTVQDIQTHTCRSASITPADVFSCMESGAQLAHAPDAIDTRTGFLNGPKKSRRTNTLASHFINRTVDAYQGAQENNQFYEDAYATRAGEARGAVKEPSMIHDVFMQGFSGDPGVAMTGSVSWGELMALNPHIDSVTEVILQNPNKPTNLHNAGMSQGWQGSDRNTQVATTLGHMLPTLMLELMLTRFTFTATNHTTTGDMEVVPSDARSFTRGLDPTPQVMQLIRRIRFEVLPMISVNNQVGFSILMDCNVLGETTMQVSIDGQPPETYVLPSFCDALLAPTMSADNNNVRGIAEDFRVLCDNMAMPAGV